MSKVYDKLFAKAIKRAERKARKQMRDDILYLIARDFVRCETCPECATPVEVMRHLKHELQAVQAGKRL